MEFRKASATSEEKSCETYNHARVRAFAKETQVPVIAFDAVHYNVSHADGLATDESEFRGLAPRLELAVGAPVLLLHNLAVEHGLINGSQGKVVDIVFAPGHHPNHDDVV